MVSDPRKLPGGRWEQVLYESSQRSLTPRHLFRPYIFKWPSVALGGGALGMQMRELNTIRIYI